MLWKKPWTQIFSRQLKIAATRITFQDQLQWEEITRKTNRKVFHTKTTYTIWPPCPMEVIGEGLFGPSLTRIRVWALRFLFLGPQNRPQDSLCNDWMPSAHCVTFHHFEALVQDPLSFRRNRKGFVTEGPPVANSLLLPNARNIQCSVVVKVA